MAESEGMHSYKSKLLWAPYGTAVPQAGTTIGFTSLGEVINLATPAIAPSVTRVTHLNSDDKAQEKVPGFTDAGQVTGTFNFFSAQMATLLARVAGAAAAAPGWGRFRLLILFPDLSMFVATVFSAGLPATVPEDDRITIDATFEVSGLPTFVGKP
jgi:hypothetical protein